MIELSLTNEPVQCFFQYAFYSLENIGSGEKKMKSQVELEPAIKNFLEPGSRPENQTGTVK